MADEQGTVPESPDVHFEPIVKLPLVETKTFEEDEEILFQMRAKLFRYDTSSENKEWKERGTGDIKILKHRKDSTIRIVMRREKTLKICANHYIRPYMELEPNNTSDRVWVWKTLADFADEEPKPELLAIKFGSAENALKFKAAFQEAKKLLTTTDLDITKGSTYSSSEDEEDDEADEGGDHEESVKEVVGDCAKKGESEKDEQETVSLTTKLDELSVEDKSKHIKEDSPDVKSPISK